MYHGKKLFCAIKIEIEINERVWSLDIKTINDMTVTFTNASKSYSAYNGATSYVVGNVVIYLNQLYRCTVNSTGNLPTDTTHWATLITNATKS